MSKPIKIYMGIPSTGTRSDLQCYILREIEDRYKEQVELVYPKQCAHRIFHDYARNEVVKEFLDTDCDVLWFLDSDVVPPHHVMDLVALHYNKWEAAGAPYPVFMSQPGQEQRQIVFTVYEGHNGGGLAPANIPMEGQKFVDGIATGCIFVKREVFERLNAPYFEFEYDSETRALTKGEDIGFCLKLSKLGIKFYVDFTAVCKHYKNVCLLELNAYAMDYAQKAVSAHHYAVREQVQEAVMAALQKGKQLGRKEALEEMRGERTTKTGLILPT